MSRDTLVDGVEIDSLEFEDASDVRERSSIEARLGELVAGRYELRELLGHGGSGAVYGATDRRDPSRGAVAVKLLHRHLRGADGHAARFEREIRALQHVAHSAVVRILDSGRDERGHLYLVMERLEGELLVDRIGERGLDVRETLELGRQLLGALGAAHDRGIIHRDIKPENLFLTDAPSGSIRLKILDWGIAKLTQPDTAISFQTLDGLILGTPEYMSPEICRGMPVTAAADLWAAAAVLYHVFAGVPPFEEDQIGRLLIKIVKEKPVPLAEHRPDLPPYVSAAIDRALDKDPARRFATAAELATGLATSAPIADLDWD
ncbi:MAG: serine/threonine protein kinase [Sandaracinaceae bacterium]|nr:serine/threonine protein kinase [Sandaracinaceae bacterium]